MNSLNLRVSTVKSGENVKKNSEMRSSLVRLPKHYEKSEESYCLQIKKANSIPDQVAVVKNIFKTIGKDPGVLRFLTDLYFYTPLKHPVRNQISKLLITAARLETGGMDENTIVESLADTMSRLLDDAKASTESSIWNLTVNSLTGCFENFGCGLKALESNVQLVFPFLCSSVQRYLTELSVLSSPSVRNEYYLYVHNSIRLILSCTQEFPENLRQNHLDQLKNLNAVCKQVINDDEIPMDPRTNSGILMAYIAKICSTYESFIHEVKLTKNSNEIVLCVGIVNTFDYHDFTHLSKDIRDICSKIDDMANANSTVPNILLCAARSLFQISKILLNFDFRTDEMSEDTKLILRKLLIFAFCYLEHHMDSVRHLCRDLLRNVIALSKKISFSYLLQKIFDACNSERLSMSMKCIVLLQAVSILGSEDIIKNCKELFSTLFAENLGRDFIVNNLFEGLMAASHKEVDFEAWKDLWITYLLEIAAKNDARLPDVEVLLVKAVKCEPRIVQHIIEHTNEIPISTKLSALWAVRKSGIKMDNFSEILHGFSKSLLFSILSNCDDTRIMALRLLVETHKTTELLTELECEHILLFLEYNSNCQSPAVRQKTLALLGKALIRCELNLVKVLKDNSSTEKRMYIKFLMDFIKILVENLFQGANFSRRSISLQLLENCVRILVNCELNLDEFLPKNTVQTLTEVISDTYEANKDIAVSILKLIEDKKGCRVFEKESIKQIKELLVSVRPADSVTGAYRLEFFCNKGSPDAFGPFELTSYCPVHYAALRWALNILKDGLRLGKESILLAAKSNPLYGVLFAIKHLLKRLDFQGFSKDIGWRILVAEVIVICKELTTVVGPVVNNSSPEGHLPNDFSELPEQFRKGENQAKTPRKILSSKGKQKSIDTLKTTPQMVLLCAWRTVKEVSLILGEVVLRSPIQYSKSTENFLVTKEQILEIGEHFKLLLSETKHRGAFEQAYVGFSKLCARLWRVESHDLNILPMTWLRELLTVISKDEQINEKICATRRSAGVPFMVQALITAELQVGTTRSLYFCMQQLIQLCGNPDKSTEARSHALNILRALFRCTDLNETIGEFASAGVMCAIRGYEASTWSEKNSATLLFSALITRIFGVQRTRDSDNLSIRNKMTGRIFFLRYPKLYDFFLDELRKASSLILKHEKANKLHPLLLMLSRLYPSALEGTESNLKLSEFIPYISNCSGCPEMQTRYLAAKAIIALISVDSLPIAILRKCAEVLISADDPKSINLNVLHGHLLQILFLIKALKTQEVELIGDICSTVVTFHSKTKMNNAVILKVMLDIFIEILSGTKNLKLPQETIKNLLHFTQQKHFYSRELSFYYPVFRKSLYIYNLHMLRLTLPFGALSDFLLSPPITHESVYLEQAETCLNIIILVLNKKRSITEDLEEYEITDAEIAFMKVLPDDMLDDLQKELRTSKKLHATLKTVIQTPKFYPECAMKAYAALSQLDVFDFTLTQLIKESKNHPGDVKSPLTLCVERLVLKKGIEFKISQLCLEYLIEITQSWNPDCLRLKASNILPHIAIHFPTALEKKKLKFVKEFISLMLSMLMDEDFDVRNNTTKIVLSLPKEDLGIENVLSTMAQRLFLQYTADLLNAMKADDDYLIDVFKAVAESQLTAANIDPSDGNASTISNSTSNGDLEVFDKNEANVFAEPLRAIADNIVIYKSTFSNRHKVMHVVNTYKIC
ncbi:thyroid adenoma-associated protein homolog [Eupeodes corollae]|uniref:thyroid adenoma-associated protein homolog n=1 Tax=Eupeodes corollae TaxID=290404 RepID=UPI00249222EF|nr:thyroid adenoma-associated protein homolog [Eupeodes corollae]